MEIAIRNGFAAFVYGNVNALSLSLPQGDIAKDAESSVGKKIVNANDSVVE
jgi:hypothetical protein